MLKFIIIVTACIFLFSCLSSPSFWRNLKHHHCYSNETEKDKKLFVFFQLFQAICLIGLSVTKLFLHCTTEESYLLFYWVVAVLALGPSSLFLIPNIPPLRTTNKISIAYMESFVKMVLLILLYFVINL